MQDWNRTPDASFVSPWYKEWDPHLQEVPVPLDHGYARGNWNSLAKQLFLFDHKPEFEPTLHPTFEWAYKQCVDMFKHYDVVSSVQPANEVIWNYEASPGFGYKKVYPTKRHALKDPDFRKESNLFWQRAHVEEYKPIWKVSSKDEYLPYDKILDENLRCFEIPPVQFLEYALRLVQPMNKRMAQHADQWWIKVGVAMQNGGFKNLMDKARRQCKRFAAGDVKKWDKHFQNVLRDYCRRLRIDLFDGKNMTVSEYADRLNYVYRVCATDTYLASPWGEIYNIQDYMKSGDPSTTYDNNIGHIILFFAYMKDAIPNLSGWEEAFKIVDGSFYADDHFFGAKEGYEFLCEFERRREFYHKAGFTLKPEDDRDQEEIFGIPFLGATCVNFRGQPAPKYSLNRIWSSLVFTGRNMPIDQYFMKARSLMVLSTFNGVEEFNRLRDFVVFVKKIWQNRYGGVDSNQGVHIDREHYIDLPGSFIPDYDYCVSWWLGWDVSC